jgi:guanosine-3',5'-bis(diphosphate) 3'-pyrophosphohydrolase
MNYKNRKIIIDARRFAREVHKQNIITTVSGDVRPQIEHLQEVADLVWASGGSETEIAASWLHDSVEDTPVTLEDIEKQFGKEVLSLVTDLTDPENFKMLPNIERKPKQAERVKNKSDSVKRIKLADQISNVRLMVTDPKDIWVFEGNRDYVIGAKLIADRCKGVSLTLDELFDKEYKMAAEYFKI